MAAAKAGAPANPMLSTAVANKTCGTGIGLANTFRFVQLHNGRIEFDSEEGRGTTFRVELPLARLVDVPAEKVRDFSQPFAQEKR